MSKVKGRRGREILKPYIFLSCALCTRLLYREIARTYVCETHYIFTLNFVEFIKIFSSFSQFSQVSSYSQKLVEIRADMISIEHRLSRLKVSSFYWLFYSILPHLKNKFSFGLLSNIQWTSIIYFNLITS